MSSEEVGQFATDLQRLSNEGVAGVKGENGVVADDFLTGSSKDASDVSAGTWRNAKGAVFEVRTASRLAENGQTVRRIGEEFSIPTYARLTDELSEGQINDIIEQVPWRQGLSREEKLDVIENVLTRAQRGDPELDIVVSNGNYIEAKHVPSGYDDFDDIRDKVIRYRVGQAFGAVNEGDVVLQPSQATTISDTIENAIGRTDGISKSDNSIQFGDGG